LDSEPVSQRRCQKAGSGGGADQRERRQLKSDDARSGALPDGDRKAAVLHRRIEGLLQRAGEAVDLVDEEHSPRLERGQEGGDVALSLECGPAGLYERDAQLGCHDLRQGGLPQPGRSG